MSSGHKADQDAADAAAALRDEEPVAAGVAADADAETPAGRERRDEARAGVESAGGESADGESAGGAEDGSVECDLAEEVAALKDQLQREQDRHLRIQAELQNTLKRLRDNKGQEIEAARTEVLLDVAEFIDDLERAL